MSDVKQAHSELVQGMPGLTSANLARAIFKADVPEQFVRTLPAQSLFMAVRHNGLGSSTDLIEIATVEQCRVMLDFDLWERDRFNEDNFWEWIALSDEDNELSILQKVLKTLDLKLVSLMLARYVDVVVFEEPTEMPPAPGYHTPDKGHTWLGINADSDKHFLLARLLAMIFETSAELFYQLVSVQSVATQSMLEEDSYAERCKRLAAEGVPEPDRAVKINSPLDPAQIMRDLEGGAQRDIVENISAVEPLVYDAGIVQPLASLVTQIKPLEDLEGELTLIMNAAITHWAVEYYEHDEISKLVARVKGAINIGLETAMEISGLPALESYNRCGLQKLYRLGLHKLMQLRKLALGVPDDLIAAVGESSPAFSVMAGARLRFPEMPLFLKHDGSVDEEALPLHGGFKSIDNLRQLAVVEGILKRDFAKK